MKKILLAALLAVSTSCAANSYKKAYVAGSVTKEFVNNAHGIYSEEFNEKLDECDPHVNPASTVTTKGELDTCMGKGFTYKEHQNILAAIGIYKAAAEALTVVLMSEGEAPDAELDEARKKALDAAFEALELLPEAAELTERLKRLLGR